MTGVGSTADAQQRVDDYFATQVGTWTDLYRSAGLVPSIYQHRHALALEWVEQLALAPGERILDVGCGAGLAAVTLARCGYVVDAVDSVEAMVCRARQAAAEAGVADRIRTAVEDVHDLRFSDATFQLVLALGVLPWLPAPRRALREMARVVRPGGYVLVSADNRWRATDVLDPLRSPLLDAIRRPVGRVLRGLDLRGPRRHREPWPRAVSIATLDRWLRHAGLRRVRGTTLGFAHFTLFHRHLFTSATSLRLHRVLQRLSDRDIPLIRRLGNQHLVLTQKVSADLAGAP